MSDVRFRRVMQVSAYNEAGRIPTEHLASAARSNKRHDKGTKKRLTKKERLSVIINVRPHQKKKKKRNIQTRSARAHIHTQYINLYEAGQNVEGDSAAVVAQLVDHHKGT